jgi:chemotaxis protein MotC
MTERAGWRALPLALLACATPAAADEQPSLQPYQMVRSLQSLQDRIAAGDHAALPMQNKLLELIDGRLRNAGDEDFAEKRNVRAALVYGMSGGNPATLAAVLKHPALSDEDRKLGKGVLAYLGGGTELAQTTLADVDPKTLAPEIGAFLALIKGSVSASGNESAALALFDTARLLGPGTLVEEAALRRSLAIEASLGKPERFFLASAQYVRRFLRSPYASQFADSFVTGILALHASLDYPAIDEITAMMDADQRKVIYLRLARRAAIEGLTELSAFAAKRAEEDLPDDRPDARSQLYSSLSNLTSENIEAVAARLKTIDREQLAESDIRLLEAAESVVSGVTAAPKLEADTPPPPAPATPAKAAAGAGAEQVAENKSEPATPKSEHAPDDAQAALVEKSNAIVPSADGGHDAPPAGIPGADGQGMAAPDDSTQAAAPADPTDTMISDARARLSAIDQMLEEAK